MPAFRNVPSYRQSGRLGKHIPVAYDKDGWEVADHKGNVDMPASSPSPMLHTEDQTRTPGHDQNPHSYQFDSSDDVDATSSVPSRRNSHTRRRDPGHIPRPRNAFIFFRSSYVMRPSGQSQQNELSKHAGRVWKEMSREAKDPFIQLAAREKEEHSAKYPNYVYSPGRNGAKGKPKVVHARNAGGAPYTPVKKRKAREVFEDNWSRSSDTSSEPSGPDSPLIPTLRLPPVKANRAAAQRAAQRLVESPRHSPISSEFPYIVPSTPPTSGYVPNADIPELDITSMTITEKPLEAQHGPPSPFHPHLDPVTGQYPYQEYVYDFMSMPILPHSSLFSGGYEEMASTSSLQTYSYAQPSPSSLSNEYVNYTPLGLNYQFNNNLQDDSMMQEFNNIDNNPNHYLDFEENPDPSIMQSVNEFTNTDNGPNEYFDLQENPDAFMMQYVNFDYAS